MTEEGGATPARSEFPQRPPGRPSRFTIGRRGGTVVVTMPGEMASDDWARLGAVLRDLIDAQGNLDVVLDLCDVVRLEHDAVRLIVHAARQAHDHGGRLRLADRACRELAGAVSG